MPHNLHRLRPFIRGPSYAEAGNHRSLHLRRESSWRALKRVPSTHLPVRWRPWVLDAGSLTKRLIRASQGDFKVRVVFQGLAYPTLDERGRLGVPLRNIALVREVELLCKGEPWVVARSIIPLSTLTGSERRLAHLGTRPLGAFLFSAPTMRRLPLELARFKPLELDPTAPCEQDSSIFGRRSVFLLQEKPMLVSELFLPRIFLH